MKKRALSLMLALMLCTALAVPAAAKDNSIKQVEEALAEGKFTDVVRDITTNINDKL